MIMSTTKITSTNPNTLFYLGLVEKANKRKDYRWTTLGKYANKGTANTIKWMIQNAKGHKAFESAAPGTYEAK
jgi:hypothetical protein